MFRVTSAKFINVMFAISFIILAVSIFSSYIQMQRVMLANSWIVQTHQVIRLTTATLSSVTQTQTSLYDLIITGDKTTYARLLQALKDMDTNLASLQSLTKDNPIQQKNVSYLNLSLERYKALIKNNLLILVNQGKEASLQPVIRDAEAKQVNLIDNFLDIINQDENILLAQRNAIFKKNINLSTMIIMMTGLFGFMVLLASVALLNFFTFRQQRMQRERHQLEFRLKKIIDSSHDFIAAVDSNKKFMVFNTAYQKLFKKIFQQDIKTGMPLKTAFAKVNNANNLMEIWDRALNGDEFTIISNFEDYKQDSHYYEANYTIIRDSDQTQIGATLMMRDITARYKVDQLKNEFISVVSHELRTPLTSIKGSLGLLVGGAVGELNDKALNMLHIAYSNCERLIDLINDILDIEKIESGKMEFHWRQINLQKLLQEAVIANQAYAEKFSTKLNLIITEENVMVRGDYGRLMQVVTNLISNGVKFSPHQSTVTIKLEKQNGYAKVSVIDQGQGVPDEFREHIFKRFSQADSSSIRKVSGSGLGLNISKAIIDKLSGNIDFISEENKGSTFYFELPLLGTKDVDASENNMPSQAETNTNLKILYVEDDKDLAEIITNILAAEAKITRANNIKEAEIELAKTKFNLVILDLELPDGSGLDLLGPLKNLGIPVVIFSAFELPNKYFPYVTATLLKSKTSNEKLIETVRTVLYSKSTSTI